MAQPGWGTPKKLPRKLRGLRALSDDRSHLEKKQNSVIPRSPRRGIFALKSEPLECRIGEVAVTWMPRFLVASLCRNDTNFVSSRCVPVGWALAHHLTSILDGIRWWAKAHPTCLPLFGGYDKHQFLPDVSLRAARVGSSQETTGESPERVE